MPVPTRSLGHVAALDGLRGLLFLVVLSAHLEPWPNVVGGQVAMSVFFALSGFLITALLLSEKARTRAVGLRDFYRRRALRLGPGLAVFLVVWLTVMAVAGGRGWTTTVPGSAGSAGGVSLVTALQAVAVALGYLTNWWTIGHLFHAYVPLGHLWSLAVEEQFYLLWAPMLAALLTVRRRLALPITLAGAGVSMALPLLYWQGGSGTARIYAGTDTRAAALLLGCCAAMVWSRGGLDRLGARAVGVLAGLATTALVAAGFGMHNSGSELAWVGGWTLAGLGSAVLLPMVVMASSGTVHRLLSTPVLAYVGRRSYGLYLWHYAFATWFNDLDLVGYVLTVGATFLAAEVSWRLVEAPALALKNRGALGSRTGPPIVTAWATAGAGGFGSA